MFLLVNIPILQYFITCMDALRLGTRAVDDLYPSLNDLYSAINVASHVPDSTAASVKKWHDRLSSMAAADEITEDESRQMFMDLEQAYNGFTKILDELKH